MQDLTPLYREHVAELERRYAALLGEHGLDVLVVHSGSMKLRSEFDDQYWPLRVVPHFQHWLPLAQADCALVLRPGARPKLVWPTAVSIWEQAPRPESDHWQASFEIVEVATAGEVKAHLPAAGVRRAFVGEGHAALGWGFAADETNPPALVGATGAVDAARVRKTAYEVWCLAEANRRAALGHRQVEAAFRDGDRSELDLHLVFLGATAHDDAETPYKNIVAFDRHAATLHHIDYARRPQAARSLLLDAGATCLGYNSDITRTHCKPGSDAGTTAFAQLLAAMERLQQRLCADVQIGRPYEELHEEAHRLVGEALREVGVTRLGVDELVDSDVTRAFFPHGLGHSLGVQTHDVGCAQIKPKPRNPFLRNTSTIALDQVFTVEPGIYFIPGLLDPLRAAPQSSAINWPLVDELSRLGGIRIEDDILVQPTGIRNLTREVLGTLSQP